MRLPRIAYPLAWLMLVPVVLRASGETDRCANYREIAAQLRASGFGSMNAYALLDELTRRCGPRLSGSANADTAVAVTQAMMERLHLDRVWRERITVPRWVRGSVEKAVVLGSNNRPPTSLSVCALGGSIATPHGGITARVIEVHSFKELSVLGEAAIGKIVFFNRPMDPTLMDTFEAYGGAVEQRYSGALQGARVGAVAVLVRSMTLALDDVPHTGSMGYADTVKKIPAAALSTKGANLLSKMLKENPGLKVRLTLSAQTLPDVPSANVLGEIRGTEKPEEVIVVGGHLDSWDKGTGAHDDGSGCMQAIEVLSLFRKLGLRPKRTVRAVMFMNEENGMRGGKAYAIDPARGSENHIALIESDRGGFAPRGFTTDADSTVFERVRQWAPCFEALKAASFARGGSGADISPLASKGIPGFGLDVETQRYFDYHHSANDTIDKVNPRELELGAIVLALLCYVLAQEGV
jgi:carboxypeptidase Q